MKITALPLWLAAVVVMAVLGPALVSAFFPLDIAGNLAKGAIGEIRKIKHGIRQHIRQRMCERLRQGRVFMEPCEQYNNQGGGGNGGNGGGGGNGYPQKEEVIIEEYERPNGRPRGGGRPHSKPVVKEEVIIEEYQPTGGGGGGGGYGRPPKKNQPVVVEETETTYVPQPSNNRPVYGGGGGGGGYGRPPRPRPQPPKPREEVSEESDGSYRVKPETVVKEMEDEGDNFHEKVEEERKPPKKPNLPGRRPGNKQGRQQQRPPPPPPPPQGGKANSPGEPCQTTEGLRGLCMPSAYCFSQYANMEDYRANRCEFSGGGGGICCPQEEPEVDVEGK